MGTPIDLPIVSEKPLSLVASNKQLQGLIPQACHEQRCAPFLPAFGKQYGKVGWCHKCALAASDTHCVPASLNF